MEIARKKNIIKIIYCNFHNQACLTNFEIGGDREIDRERDKERERENEKARQKKIITIIIIKTFFKIGGDRESDRDQIERREKKIE